VEIQRQLKKENDRLVEDKRLLFRIGVNIGDVVHDGDRIYGEGVNIAARIESLADAGGVCISRNTYDHIKNKMQLETEYLGEHEVKNIEEPVRVYKVVMASEYAGKLIGDKPKPFAKHWIWATIVVAMAVIISVVWLINQNVAKPDFEPVPVEKMAYPLPDKPSIAVLPFENMSDDPNQEYFGDGLAEDLITDLAKISGLLVISRNSTFVYKDKSIGTKQIAENLGARYVLEGSVRKVRDQVRINAQLIDAPTQHHLWAERFDGPLSDIFSLQDKIARKIVASLAVKLTEPEQENVYRKETDDIKAYDALLKGADLMKRYSPDRTVKAIPYFEEAIKLDPNYSRAYAGLAEAYIFAGIYGGRIVGLSPRECFLRGEHNREISMKNPTYGSYMVNAYFFLPVQRRWEEAIADGERGVALAPKESSAFHALGWALIWGGRPEEAADVAVTALRVDHGCVY
jgi:TolB-like protein